MSETETKQLEDFLFSKNKADFLSKLIPGTDSFYYFSLLNAINQYGLNLSKEQNELLEKYSSFKTIRAENIKARFNFLSLTKKDITQAEKNKIIGNLNNSIFNLGFDFDVPCTIPTSIKDSLKTEVSSHLDPSLLDWRSSFLSSASTNIDKCRTLEKNALINLEIEDLIKGKNIEVLGYYLRNVGIADVPNVEKVVFEYFKLNQEKNKNFTLESFIFDEMTLEQLKNLDELIKDLDKNVAYVMQLFLKEFPADSDNNRNVSGTPEAKLERRKDLLKKYNWTLNLNLNRKFNSFSQQLLYEILQIGIETNLYDFDLFIDYLKEPKSIYSNMVDNLSDLFHKRNYSYESFWHSIHDIDTSKWIDQNNLIELYLTRYFVQNKKIGPFDMYLKTDFLNKLFHKTRLYEGEVIPNINDILPAGVIKSIQDEKLISICKYNKEFFEKADEVSLFIELKNIPNLNIKIFEISTEAYYLKNKAEIAATISLDGLIAKEELFFDFNDVPAQKKFTKEIKFPSITKKAYGVFIVDFIGNGVSSRALIRKGKLLILQKNNLAGQLLTILDHNLEICQNKGRTGVWLEERFHEANASGQIALPFSNAKADVPLIIIHEDFASLSKIDLVAEVYDFKCAYIYKDESILMGSNLKILLQPRLYLNGTVVNMEIIKEISVKVTTLTGADLPSTIIFDNVKFDYKNEYEVEIPITSCLQSIIIEVCGKIKKLLNKEEQNIFESKQIVINSFNNDQNKFCGLFLSYTSDGYELSVLGKNGEPKAQITVNLNINHKKITSDINCQLETDKNGKIHLGNLENVTRISASIREKGDISASNMLWNLGNNNSVDYPKEIHIFENDELTLPYFGKELNRKKLSFLKFTNFKNGNIMMKVNDFLSSLKLDKNCIVIGGLKKGLYRLLIRDSNTTVQITVHEGKYWKNSNIMVINDYLFDNKTKTAFTVIEDVQLTKAPEGKCNLDFNINTDDSKFTRVHVLAYNFLNQNVDNYCQSLNSNIITENSKIISNSAPKNEYFSNKSLSEEYCYVLNRKKENRYVGNTLEKPPVLLKRKFVRDTKLNKEQLSQGSNFKDQIIHKEMEMLKRGGNNYLQRNFEKYDMAYAQNSENCFLNFLPQPSLIIANIIPKEDGSISLKNLDLKDFSTIEILACSLLTSSHCLIPLENGEKNFRDLRQKTSEDKNKKFFSIFRNTSTLLKGQKIKIDDLTSTELKIVDTLEKLFKLQKELRKCDLLSENENGIDLDKWSFITKWKSLSFEEKQKKYDEFAGHELNLFIFFKDPHFFNTVVKSFISNKLEKSLIDYFLLNDGTQLASFLLPQSTPSLNILEIILLIIFLKKSGDIASAEDLVNYLENKCKLSHPSSVSVQKYFDTILGSKSIAPQEFEFQDDFEEGLGGGGGGGGEERNLMDMEPMCKRSANYDLDNLQPYSMAFQTCSARSTPQYFQIERKKMGVGRVMMQEYAENVCCEKEDLLLLDQEEMAMIEEQRSKYRVEFKNADKTKEYCERTYYNTSPFSNEKELITINQFWGELARAILESKDFNNLNFLSSKFIFCNDNFVSLLAVLTFIDIPFELPNHKYTSIEGKGMEIEASSNLIIFHKEIKEAKSELKNSIMIAQRYYDYHDRYYTSEDGKKTEKDVDEYIVDKIYDCQIIITNATISQQEFQILYEIPEGALPVIVNEYTKSQPFTLNSFTTKTLDYYFYFPFPGKFSSYPANLSKDGLVYAIAQDSHFDVRLERTQKKSDTIDQVLSQGSKEDILEFVEKKNIFNSEIFSFRDIYYLLKDADFYLKIVKILRKRRFFDKTVWSFSIYHKDLDTFKEFVNHHENIELLRAKFKFLKNEIVSIKDLNILEYYPLNNSRVHQLSSDKNKILNHEFNEQYYKFLQYLIEVPTPDIRDLLVLTYYLILQERIDEATSVFNKINISNASSPNSSIRLQYDYFTAYLDFYNGAPEFKKARVICENYLDYPIINWRNLFYEIANQLAEYDGEELIDHSVAAEDKDAISKKKAGEAIKKESFLEAELNNNQIIITSQNNNFAIIDYYFIDLEVLFSRNPFLTHSFEDLSFISPNHSEKVFFENTFDLSKKSINLSKNLEKQNVLIIVRTGDKKKTLTYYSSKLEVIIVENYAQVKVYSKEANKPLPKVYVKVFSENESGVVSFYKDGYTDIRGRFDYATLNNDTLNEIKRFSIFIMSDELGSLIKEAKKPSMMGKMEETIQLNSKKWNEKRAKK